MSNSDSNEQGSGPSAMGRMVALAQRGRLESHRKAVAFSQWFKERVSEQGNRLTESRGERVLRGFAERHLRQRQQVYRKGSSKKNSSIAEHALRRAAQASEGRGS